jgi:hypothetical protein
LKPSGKDWSGNHLDAIESEKEVEDNYYITKRNPGKKLNDGLFENSDFDIKKKHRDDDMAFDENNNTKLERSFDTD